MIYLLALNTESQALDTVSMIDLLTLNTESHAPDRV